MHGFLFVDKPQGVTSHDVVARLRRITGIRRIGHTGTLDPFATGMLIVAIGKATRLIRFTSKFTKTYQAVIRLGVETDTLDPTGAVTRYAKPSVTTGDIIQAVKKLTGTIIHPIPRFSAVKINGRRSYELARQQSYSTAYSSVNDIKKDDSSPRPPNRLTKVYKFELERIKGQSRFYFPSVTHNDANRLVEEDYLCAKYVRTKNELTLAQSPRLKDDNYVEVLDLLVTVICTTGTYVRSLAETLGHELCCPAHLDYLHRSQIGSFSQMHTLDSLTESLNNTPDYGLVSVEEMMKLILPGIELSSAVIKLFQNGQVISINETNAKIHESKISDTMNKNTNPLAYAVYSQEKRLVGIGYVQKTSLNERKQPTIPAKHNPTYGNNFSLRPYLVI